VRLCIYVDARGSICNNTRNIHIRASSFGNHRQPVTTLKEADSQNQSSKDRTIGLNGGLKVSSPDTLIVLYSSHHPHPSNNAKGLGKADRATIPREILTEALIAGH
jgi:hypothetical protein